MRRATTLAVLDGVDSASFTWFDVGALLVAAFIVVDELNISVDINGDLEVGHGGFLVVDLFTTRNLGAGLLLNLSLEAVGAGRFPSSGEEVPLAIASKGSKDETLKVEAAEAGAFALGQIGSGKVKTLLLQVGTDVFGSFAGW